MRRHSFILGISFIFVAGVFYLAGEKSGAGTRAAAGRNDLLVESVALLRNLNTSALPSGIRVFVQGYYAPGDEGGGTFTWSRSPSLKEDGGLIFSSARGSGFWVRSVEGAISVRWFGAKGDGVANDQAAFRRALAAAAGRRLRIPAGNYLLEGETMTIAPHSTLVGDGRGNTTLSRRSDSDLFVIGEGVALSQLGFVGNGNGRGGGCFVFKGASGRQSLREIRAVNFDGPVLYFERGAGSQFSASNCIFSRLNAPTGSERYAVVIDPAQQLSAVPRKFELIETNGQCAFDFGGCNDVFISSSFLGDLKYSDDSRGVLIVNSRVANQAILTVRGHNNALVLCNLAPQVILAKNADNVVIGPNSYNRTPLLDQSGNGRNLVFMAEQDYTPDLSSGGGDSRLGNGTIRGSYSRQGAVVFATIELILGSDTDLGTSELRFSLPVPAASGLVQYPGQAVLMHQGAQFSAVAQVVEAKGYILLIRDGSGIVSGRSPVVWAPGDTIRISVAYLL